MDHAAAAAKLCWGEVLKFEKGCFLEISSPEWAQFLGDGDKAHGLRHHFGPHLTYSQPCTNPYAPCDMLYLAITRARC